MEAFSVFIINSSYSLQLQPEPRVKFCNNWLDWVVRFFWVILIKEKTSVYGTVGSVCQIVMWLYTQAAHTADARNINTLHTNQKYQIQTN